MKYIRKINESIDNKVDLDFIKQETFVLKDIENDGLIYDLEYHTNRYNNQNYFNISFAQSENDWDNINIENFKLLFNELSHLKSKFQNDKFNFKLSMDHTDDNKPYYIININKII